MIKTYLRVEAVNLDYFVYDTQDISTIRGGSYLLLAAIESLRDAFRGRMTPISTAASQGLFWFEASESDWDQACQDMRRDVLQHLHQKTNGHATFVVATQEDNPNDFRQVLERLEAQVRRQQWRMPTVVVPGPAPAAKECYLDGWRPGVDPYRVDPDVEDAWMSEATAYRRSQGRQIKHDLFYELLGDEQYLGQISTRDLGELSQDPAKGILNGKIAFIHVDGNSFGHIRRVFCETEQDREEFDRTIQDGFRKSFLEAVLHHAKNDPHFQIQGADGRIALRLEVLLWGGDEMTLVVPAWQAWQTMRLFFEKARTLQFRDVPLSHRAIIIFCHHNAPILLIRALADDLLARTKEDIKARLNVFPAYRERDESERERLKAELSDHTYGDALHYLVLESFDLLQGDSEKFLEHYYKGGNYTDLLIYAHELDTVLTEIDTIKTRVARGKALQVIKALEGGNTDEVGRIFGDVYKLLPLAERGPVQDAVEWLTKASIVRWYLATDLWDYVPEGAIP